MTNLRRFWPWPVFLILALSLILRSLWLGREGLWIDEMVSWWWSKGDLKHALAVERSNPPLYYVLLFCWVQIFGNSEIALRSFSIPPSIGSLVLVYFLGRRLFTPTIALVALGIMGLSSFQIAYAQEARTHAWLSFLILTATIVLLEALQSTGRRRLVWWTFYTALAIACFYMHYISPFFFASHGLYTLGLTLTRRQSFRPLLEHAAAGGLAALAFLPQILYILSGAGSINRPRGLMWLKLPQTYFSLLFGDSLIPLDRNAVNNIRGTLLDNAPYLIGAIAAMALLLPFVWRGFQHWKHRAALVYLMTVAPVVSCFIVSFKESVFDERYMLSVAPFLCLALAAAVAEVFSETRPLWRLAGFTAAGLYVALLLIALAHLFFEPRFGKEQWRVAIAALETQADPARDQILLEPDYLHLALMYYGRRGVPFTRILDQDRASIIGQQSPLEEKFRHARRVWFVRSHHEDDQILDALRRQFDQKNFRHYSVANHIEIYEFAPRN